MSIGAVVLMLCGMLFAIYVSMTAFKKKGKIREILIHLKNEFM